MIGRHTETTDRRPRYAATEIDAFLADLDAAIPSRVKINETGNRMTLVEARQKIGTPLLTVKALIEAGKVPSAAIDPAGQGLGAIHLDLEEARNAVVQELLDAVPKLKTAKFLGGSLPMVDYLLTTGELKLEMRG